MQVEQVGVGKVGHINTRAMRLHENGTILLCTHDSGSQCIVSDTIREIKHGETVTKNACIHTEKKKTHLFKIT